MGFHSAARHSRTGLSALVLAVLALLLMGADSHFAWTRYIRGSILTALYPIQRMAGAPMYLTETLQQEIRKHIQIYQENERLRQQVQRLRLQSQELQALHRENQRLRELLNEAKRLDRQVAAAQVIAESPDPFHHTLTVTRGESHGAFTGQPVINADGIVGQVTATSPLTSQIILITDPNSAVPVLVRDSRVRGILTGTGDRDLLKLRYVPNSSNVQVGDALVTSGMGQVFPKGLKAGRVVEVIREPHSPFLDVTARPAVPVSRLEDVLLLEQEAPGDPDRTASVARSGAP